MASRAGTFETDRFAKALQAINDLIEKVSGERGYSYGLFIEDSDTSGNSNLYGPDDFPSEVLLLGLEQMRADLAARIAALKAAEPDAVKLE